MEAQEKVFFQDNNVTVTSSRFISQGKTYAMNNISSVYANKLPRKITFSVLLILTGVVFLILGLHIGAGLGIAGLGALLLLVNKQKYSVKIQSNAGEVDGFVSTDRQYVEVVVRCINDAIVHRG